MACTCINEDGTRSGYCRGCTKSTVINVEEQTRAQDDGFNSRQISQIVSAVSHVFENSNLHRDLWVEGFLKGFEEGKNYG